MVAELAFLWLYLVEIGFIKRFHLPAFFYSQTHLWFLILGTCSQLLQPFAYLSLVHILLFFRTHTYIIYLLLTHQHTHTHLHRKRKEEREKEREERDMEGCFSAPPLSNQRGKGIAVTHVDIIVWLAVSSPRWSRLIRPLFVFCHAKVGFLH